jgi:hypothetical protein
MVLQFSPHLEVSLHMTDTTPAYSRTLNDKTHPLDISLPQLEHDTRINTHSPLLAASLFIQSSSLLPSTASKTFIFTGNMLNEVVNPVCLGFGMGKSSTAHVIRTASLVHGPQGIKYVFPWGQYVWCLLN